MPYFSMPYFSLLCVFAVSLLCCFALSLYSFYGMMMQLAAYLFVAKINHMTDMATSTTIGSPSK